MDRPTPGPRTRGSAGESLHLLAEHHHRKGALTPAIRYYQEALAIHADVTEPALRAAIQYQLGLAYAQLPRFDEARDNLTRALAGYTELGNRIDQVKALTQLGMLAHRTGRHDEAADLFERAIAVDGERVADRDDLLLALVTLSELCCDGNRPAKVLTHAREAIGRCHPGRDYQYRVRAQVALVRALHATGRIDEANRETQQTIALIAEVDDPHDDAVRRQFELLNLGLGPAQ